LTALRRLPNTSDAKYFGVCLLCPEAKEILLLPFHAIFPLDQGDIDLKGTVRSPPPQHVFRALLKSKLFLQAPTYTIGARYYTQI
jgi:hypothetical protein